MNLAPPTADFAPHLFNGNPIAPPFPQGLHRAVFGMGCFWGAEKIFWPIPGVYVTAVGYCGGSTPQPDYSQVCSGLTGHTEVVLVVFDPNIMGYRNLLSIFWENHDPTQGDRQGNDVGSQYRSTIYACDQLQQQLAEQSRHDYSTALEQANYPAITTEIKQFGEFFYSEPYHQQYLLKNPQGYCAHTRTGVRCPPIA